MLLDLLDMSSFTALNGASSKPGDQYHDATEKASAPEGEVRGSITVRAQGSQSPLPNKARVQEQDGREPQQDLTRRGEDEANKRKRSDSEEPRHDVSSREMREDTTPTSASSHDAYDGRNTPTRDHDLHGHDHREQIRDERNGYEPQRASAASPEEHTDDQIGDALRRAAGQMDQHSDYGNESPEAEERHGPPHGNAYYVGHRSDMVHHDPKKRKRNFSNRTKTGCLTCRKRKKKCDELKPECKFQCWRMGARLLGFECPPLSSQPHETERLHFFFLCTGSNCIRGGFLCAGYPPQRNTWQKPEVKQPAVPLESKDPSYVPPGAYGMPQPGAYGPQSLKREPLPHYRGQILRIDPPQGRPLVAAEDDRPTATTMTSASTTSPENKLSGVPYTPANMFPTPISANTQPSSFGDRSTKEYHPRVPPLHELARGGEREPETPHPGNQLPQINILHARATSPGPHSHQGPAPPPPPPPPPPGAGTGPPPANPQVAAQLALSHPHPHSQSHGHSPYPQRRTQKEEMLSGRQFYPFDKELCLERERCAAACWRFNNLTTPPSHGVSPDERARLFLEILQPRDPVRVSPIEASPVTNVGRVGRHVAVETPFTCDYGYNISIGHHVVIGRNCTINDVAEVKIGDNCVLGPNVSVFTASLPIDPKKRQGGQGPQFGRPITIEQDCWIGGGAMILAGRTIGKGATVGAGSIVTKVCISAALLNPNSHSTGRTALYCRGREPGPRSSRDRHCTVRCHCECIISNKYESKWPLRRTCGMMRLWR